MTEHVNITDPQIHEPKGAATADEGSFYVANGTGSGSWKLHPLGWGYYLDNASAQTVGTTPVRLSINGSDTLSTSAYLPREIRGTGELWDTTTDTLTPIGEGDGYDVRIELPVTADAGAGELTVELDISGSGSTIILSRFFTLAKTPPYTISFGFPLVVLNSTVAANGIGFYLSTDAGTIDVTAPSILIKRDFDGAL